LQKDGYRKEVTGLLVNDKVNVQKRYIKQLRMWLYYWETYGYEKAYNFFLQQYRSEKGHIKKVKPDMENVIGGKLDFLRMVKGADNEMYLNLKGRFDGLIRNNNENKLEITTSVKQKIANQIATPNVKDRRQKALCNMQQEIDGTWVLYIPTLKKYVRALPAFPGEPLITDKEKALETLLTFISEEHPFFKITIEKKLFGWEEAQRSLDKILTDTVYLKESKKVANFIERNEMENNVDVFSNSINKLLEIWEQKGIDEAMKVYFKNNI
jgi:hypothetical protein